MIREWPGVVLRFAGGVIVGAAAWLSVGLVWPHRDAEPRAAADLRVSGPEISARGAAFVTIRTRELDLRQACRGGCDDLVAARGGGLPVEFQDAHSRPLGLPE